MMITVAAESAGHEFIGSVSRTFSAEIDRQPDFPKVQF